MIQKPYVISKSFTTNGAVTHKLAIKQDLFRLCHIYKDMVKNQRIPKLTFTITPNPNGFVVGCNEIPYLFTDLTSIADIDKTIRDLLFDFIESFPDDAKKRGVDRNTLTQTIWRGSPNSVALE